MATPIPVFLESTDAESPSVNALGKGNTAIAPRLDAVAQAELAQAEALLCHYSFELGSFQSDGLPGNRLSAKGLPTNSLSAKGWPSALRTHQIQVDAIEVSKLALENWANTYPAFWIRIAVIEALYQGRYKLISVAQILEFWQRRQQPIPHFTHEFERLVSDRFPRNLLNPAVLPSRPAADEPKPWIHSGPPAWINLAKQIQAERHPQEALL
jgi:hypothetical protein